MGKRYTDYYDSYDDMNDESNYLQAVMGAYSDWHASQSGVSASQRKRYEEDFTTTDAEEQEKSYLSDRFLVAKIPALGGGVHMVDVCNPYGTMMTNTRPVTYVAPAPVAPTPEVAETPAEVPAPIVDTTPVIIESATETIEPVIPVAEPEDVFKPTIITEDDARKALGDRDVYLQMTPAPVRSPKLNLNLEQEGRKNISAIIIGFMSSIALFVLAIMSLVNSAPQVTNIVNNQGAAYLYDQFISVVMQGSTANVLHHIFAFCTLAAAVCMVIGMVTNFFVLCMKALKGRGLGIVFTVSLVGWIGCGIMAYFCGKRGDMVAFLNPTIDNGLQIGYYICLGLLIIETVCGYLCFRSDK